MKLRNKIFLVLLLILLFNFLLNFNNVKAVEYDGQLPSFSSLSSEYNLNNYCIWTFNGTTYLALSNDSEFMIIGGDYWSLSINGVVFENIDNKWVLFKEHLSSSKTWDFPLVKREGNPILSDIIYYCNVKLYHDAGSFNMNASPIPDDYVFFRTAVVLVEGVEELPGVIAETMKVIIPVGLIVLVVILLIYLIKRVIYLSH